MSPSKPLLKSKAEGKILGLPKEDTNDSNKSFENLPPEEPSFYFYEDDESELIDLIDMCLPILTHLE